MKYCMRLCSRKVRVGCSCFGSVFPYIYLLCEESVMGFVLHPVYVFHCVGVCFCFVRLLNKGQDKSVKREEWLWPPGQPLVVFAMSLLTRFVANSLGKRP